MSTGDFSILSNLISIHYITIAAISRRNTTGRAAGTGVHGQGPARERLRETAARIRNRQGDGFQKEAMAMAGFVPKDKMSKKAKKELNRRRRRTWDFSPVTKTVESRKLYNRKRNSHDRQEDDYGMGVFQSGITGPRQMIAGEEN